MLKKKSDRRQFERRSINRVVSFQCPGGSTCVDWHLGRIQDVGSGGLRIKVQRSVTLNRGQSLVILCLQEIEDAGQEPVRILGRVAWQNADTQCFGLQFR